MILFPYCFYGHIIFLVKRLRTDIIRPKTISTPPPPRRVFYSTGRLYAVRSVIKYLNWNMNLYYCTVNVTISYDLRVGPWRRWGIVYDRFFFFFRCLIDVAILISTPAAKRPSTATILRHANVIVAACDFVGYTNPERKLSTSTAGLLVLNFRVFLKMFSY